MTPVDKYGSTILASDLPRECKPPYRGTTVWAGEHRGWRIIVRRIENDPASHLVASGQNPGTGKYEWHARREAGATPASARHWVDELLAGNSQAAARS